MRENHSYTVPERWLADLDAIPDGDTGEPQSGYLVGVDIPTAYEKAMLRKLAEEFGGGPNAKGCAAPGCADLDSRTHPDTSAAGQCRPSIATGPVVYREVPGTNQIQRLVIARAMTES